MRRRLSAASLIVAGLAAACSNDRLPTSPQSVDPSTVNSTLNADGCVASSGLVFVDVNTEVSSLIVQLFEGSHESSTATMWETIKRDKLEGKPVQNHIDNLAKWTLEKLSERVLLDPDGPSGVLNATTGSVRLLDLVFDCTGVTPTQLPEPPADFNAAWELVNPSTDAQQFNTNAGDAGAWIPPADEGGTALEDRTLLVIVQQPPEVQVNTPFPKLTNTVDVALAGGKLRAGRKLSVLFCPLSETIDPAVNQRAVIAHQKTGVGPNPAPGEGVEYLPPEEGGNLDCDNLQTASWRTEKGFLRQRAMQVAWYARKAWKLVSPKPAYAVHAAIGGSTPFGSPMVGADPYLVTNIEITSVTPNPATYGETVNVTARLHIADVAANPAPYRNTYVNPDVVYTALNGGVPVVNKTQTRGTNLPMAASVDGGARTPAVTDDVNSAASWAFPCLNAAGHTVRVDFAETYVTANAPVYGASTASQAFTVNPRDLTIQAASPTRTYGDVTPALGGTMNGVQSCDEASNVQAIYEAWEDEARTTPVSGNTDVGSYTVFPRVNFVAPALASNYNVIPTNGTLTVIPRPINLNIVQPVSRQYGDPNDPALTEATAASGYDATEIRNGDVLTFSLSAPTALPLSPAGSSHSIAVARGGARLGNYTVTVVPADPQLTITLRILTGAANPGQREFGEPNPTFTGTVNNTTLCCSATDGLVVTWQSDATPLTPAGAYDPPSPNAIRIVLSGGPEANYDVSAVAGARLTITQAPLDIGANSISLPFGTTYGPNTLTGSVLFGAKNGDAIGVLSSTSPAANATTPPGSYTLNPFLPVPWPNYVVRNRVTGTLTITPVDAPATLSGQWTGTYSWVCNEGLPNRNGSTDVLFTIGGTEDGIRYTGTASYLGGSAPFTLTRHTSATLRDIGAQSASGQYIRIVLGESRTGVAYNEFVGPLSGSTISGETLNGDSEGGCSAPTGPSGTFSVTRTP